MDSLIAHLKNLLKRNPISQDLELIEFLSTLESSSCHILADDESLDVTIFLPTRVFKEHFGHLELEI